MHLCAHPFRPHAQERGDLERQSVPPRVDQPRHHHRQRQCLRLRSQKRNVNLIMALPAL